MKVFTKCAYCKSDISFWTWNEDRVKLKMSLGDKLDLTCKKCNKTSNYDVDDLRAKESKLAIIIALVIFVIITPLLFVLLWDYIWQSGVYGVFAILFIIATPSIIFRIINQQDSQRVSRFNRS